ncbi:MAG: hypothetical protein H7A49_15300 [Akkermansiaceae bacterium]|nr:hypothetical protein [Akkermansiaceae bacterium]MCP5545261.1 hypothetical protein [Akkermansiaceae bacterium]
MRWFLPWLLLLGMLAGPSSRLVGADPCDAMATVHESEHSHDHGHHPEHPCSPGHDKNCPMDHHSNHGFCCHQMPMSSDEHAPVGARHLPFSLSPVREDSNRIPDEPCSKLDKPPLI